MKLYGLRHPDGRVSDVRRLTDDRATQLRAAGEDLVELPSHLPADGHVYRLDRRDQLQRVTRSADELLERRARRIPLALLAGAAAGDESARRRLRELLAVTRSS